MLAVWRPGNEAAVLLVMAVSLPSFPRRSDEASAEMEELAKISANPEEIALGSSGEESEGEEGGKGGVEEVALERQMVLEQQVIPSAVFGSIPEEKQGEVLGARERLAARKKTS